MYRVATEILPVFGIVYFFENAFHLPYNPLNLERIAVACNSGFPLPASSGLLPARPTHALRCSRSFKKLVVRAPITVLEVSTPTRILDVGPYKFFEFSTQ